MKKATIFLIIIMIISAGFLSGCNEQKGEKKVETVNAPLNAIGLTVKDFGLDFIKEEENYTAESHIAEHGPLKGIKISEVYEGRFINDNSSEESTEMFFRFTSEGKCSNAFDKFISYLKTGIIDKPIETKAIGEETYFGENTSLYQENTSLYYLALTFRIADVMIILSGYFQSPSTIVSYAGIIEDNINKALASK